MLRINNISVSVNAKLIINNLSISCAPGSVHILMGPNGSGKSTLAHTLMGHPHCLLTDGSIEFNRQEINALSLHERARAGVFVALQNPIALPGVEVATFLKEAVHTVQQHHYAPQEFLNHLYELMDCIGIDHSYAHRSVHEGFSGGEKKRLELLQMMLLKPRIAVLDEIDSGLDVDALACVGRAVAYLKKEQPDAIVLLITHYNRLLSHVHPDAVHVIKDGTLIRSGDLALAHMIESGGYDAV